MPKLDYGKMGMRVLGVGGGIIAADALDAKLLGSKVSPLIKSIIKMGIGVVGPELVKNKKSKEMISNLGDGFIAAGARQLAEVAVPGLYTPKSAEPPVEGIGEDTAYVTDEVVEGIDNADGLGGVENPEGLGGIAGDDEDYD